MEEVSDTYDPHAVEDEVRSYWDESGAYKAAVEAHDDDPDYYFLDGPPYTSGQMHLGTAWNKTLKDAVIRYLRMRGYNVTDRPGYDMHGLPIEVKVEEELGFEDKNDIKEFGVDEFIEECKRFAEDNLESMNEDFQRMGVWMDWSDPYRTVSDEYIEGAWWGFKKAHDRGLVEEGKQVINQCPRCETAIADAEVEYEEIESPSIYVKFPLRDEDGSLVIWTTTPWTIPANIYAAVDPELEYQKIRAERNNETDLLYLASECVEEVLREARYKDYETVETLSGEELVGKSYTHPLMNEVPRQQELAEIEGVHRVYGADFVSAERTGLVHAAPGHGVDDFELGQKEDLPVFSPVSGNGVYTEGAGKYSGEFVRDTDQDVINDLESKGALLSEGRHTHRYGHCWRCDTPIIFLATDQWFIRVTEIKERLLEEINESTWYPKWARDSRFHDWVENARDWCVSRQRYWGIPIPIWICGEGHETCIGTREELEDRAINDFDVDGLDLHRPGVDPINIECPECGGVAERVEDIFDVWLDSSVASWAALDYPSKEQDFERLWPADLIIEAHDQTRGWFWSQLGMGVSAMDEIPYKNVVMHGHALDEEGRKMSKSLGNIVTPQEAIDRYGVDPLRVFLLSNNQQGEDMRFSWDEIEDRHRTLNVVWNTYRFPLPYMRLDGFEPRDESLENTDLTVIDEWVLSRLQHTKMMMKNYMEDYRVDRAQQELLDFIVGDVSRYYVQVVRPRMWEEEESPQKQAAYSTLYTVLTESSRLLAPFAPHIAESMYRNLTDSRTVHAEDWPTVNEDLRDTVLEDRVAVLREVEEAAANARQRGDRKLRWPVKQVVVQTENEDVREAVLELENLLLRRVNAREVVVVEEWDELIEVAEPQMDVIGPEFGEKAQKVMEAVEGKRRNEVEEGIEIDGETLELTTDMLEFREETPEGVESAEFEGGMVYIDTSLDEGIEREGYSREIVRRIQEMRKQLDLEVDQHIRVSLNVQDDRVESLVRDRMDYIAEETRTTEFVDSNELSSGLVEEWVVEDVEVKIAVEPV